MTTRAGRNRLDEEGSPYLRQHADNPVHWQPWDERALEEARERDVPIFLSIGYSACHWCHVMEEESFEDEEVAGFLNEHFVPIKVDREERPDLDSVYMTVCQLVTGGGGWPLSAWLTPAGEPFYVGTYFPKRSRRQNQPGFLDLLRGIADSWENDREQLQRRADQWTEAVRNELEDVPDQPGETPDSAILEEATRAAVRSADREHGGFGRSGPKFPQPGRISLLLRSAARGSDAAGRVATETLDAMAGGGLYDHVGGGFHRYATDREWTVPHFEKMLYDQAELTTRYLEAAQLTGEARYARVAQETLAFVERELTHPDGGFYSTLDARSEGTEGAFYVWTPSQVREALDDDLTADLFVDRYGVTSGGNFEGGKTVLTVSASVSSLADEYDLDESEVTDRLNGARAALYDRREERPRPRRDEKVLAGWNGLMISAYAVGARVLDSELGARADEALSFVREHLWDESEGRLARRYKDGDVKGDGYLEDYAFLARGALDRYQTSGDVEDLAFALDLARVLLREFWDEEAGTLYFTPRSGERLVTRPQELTDQSTPSSVGVAVSALSDLDHFAPDEDFGETVDRVLATHAKRVRSSPLEYVSLALAADRRDRGALELTVAADGLPVDWEEVLGSRFLPDALVSLRPPTADGLADWLDRLGVDEAPPIWAGREARDGEPTVYACRSFTCSPPLHDVAAAVDWFEGDDPDARVDADAGADDLDGLDGLGDGAGDDA